MSKTACKLPNQKKEIAGDNAAQLRLLRNKFLKHYIKDGKELTDKNLTALLLFFAVRFLNKDDTHVNTGLFDSILTALPENLRQVMPCPDKESWQEAKLFFKNFEDDLFADIANLGFAYQVFSLGTRKHKALPALQKADKKITKEELIAFTQLYTPTWIVDFLVANTIIPLIQKRNISERYKQWLLPENGVQEKQFELSQLSVLDPACGSGQFLFSAFDLLLELHQQKGFDLKDSMDIIIGNNIFAADIDEKALWVAGLGLASKCLLVSGKLSKQPLNFIWLSPEDLDKTVTESNFLGSIDKRLKSEHFLKQKCKVVVTNPPYLGRKCLSRDLKFALKEQYPRSANDLAAAFLECCVQMLEPGGKFGVITQSSFLAIPSYKDLRNYVLDNYHLNASIHCGPGVFPLSSGEKIDSLLLVFTAPQSQTLQKAGLKTYFIDLSNTKAKSKKLIDSISGTASGEQVNCSIAESMLLVAQESIKNTGALLSGLPPVFIEHLTKFPQLGAIAEVRQGLATTDNNRFVRYRFDVDEESIGKVWKPYIKGAGCERFASEDLFVVKWGNDGIEIKDAVLKAYPYLKGKTAWVVKNENFYFRPGLCFSFINKNGLAVRRLLAGAIFDVASSAIFVKPEEEDFLLAYLNSTFAGILAKAINQTINMQVGDIKKIPICNFDQVAKEKLSTLGKRAYDKKLELLQSVERQALLETEKRLSAKNLEGLFDNFKHHIDALCIQFNGLQREIDSTVRNGLKQLNILDKNTETFLIEQEKAINFNDRLFTPINEKTFAFKILGQLVSQVIDSDGRERIVTVQLIDDTVLANLLKISGCGQKWLETHIGKSFTQLFCQPKLLDMDKMVGNASRYFSLWSKENNTCTFFSACAIRNLLREKMAEAEFRRVGSTRISELINQLEQITDWTSKDIIKILAS